MTVVAKPMSDDESQTADDAMCEATRTPFCWLWRTARMVGMSMTDLALACGWRTSNGKANKSKVQRLIERLKKAKLVISERGGVSLTPKGVKEVEKLER